MTDDAVEFYMRHRRQISQWAALKGRAERLVRDAVAQRSSEAAINVLMADTKDADVDFYIRNRSLIAEWAELRLQAGTALHGLLLEESRAAGFDVTEEGRGWTGVKLPNAPDLPSCPHPPVVALYWTKQYLLKDGAGYPFPRVVLSRDPVHWRDGELDRIIVATKTAAVQLGMKKQATNTDKWWVHWGMLPEISDSEDLRTYALSCLARARERRDVLVPMVCDAMVTAES